jgi:hypothetical protein
MIKAVTFNKCKVFVFYTNGRIRSIKLHGRNPSAMRDAILALVHRPTLKLVA